MGILDQLNMNQQQKAVGARYPFIGDGNHVLDVLEFRHFNSQDRGLTIACDFVAESSDKIAAGSIVTTIFQVQKTPEFASMTSDYDRLCDLLEKICGKPFGTGPELIKAVLNDQAMIDQPLRGARVKAYGVSRPSKKTGKVFCSVTWTSIDQTEADIKARRAAVDKARAGVPAAPAAAVAARAPAPAGWEYGPDGNLRQAAAAQPPPTTGLLGSLLK